MEYILPNDPNIVWYVGRSRSGQEMKIKRFVESQGIEHFIPTKIVVCRVDGKKQEAERPIIKNLIFVRATKQTATALANEYGLPITYLIDRTRKPQSMMVVPDKQMQDFMTVVESRQEELRLLSRPVAVGDRVRVISGDFEGVEGNVLDVGHEKYIVVAPCGLLQAIAKIDPDALEIIR